MEKSSRRRIGLIVILVLLLLVLAVAAGILLWWNRLLNLMGDAAETVHVSAVTETLPQTQPPETTLPEETWPKVEPSEEITNIMLIGQNCRKGENHNLADTMILCSLNRETRTLTMVSFLRDLYLPVPDYAGRRIGRNRMNVCYHWGSKLSGTPQGGMELLSDCVETNFGVPVDHSVVVDFDAFTQVIDSLGGVEIDLSEAEARYLTNRVGYVGEFSPGPQTLNGLETLAYARIRKIDSDIHRTGRQRAVLTSLMEKCRTLNLKQMYSLAETILPLITTDMTNQEITNYLWEVLPMLKDLQIRSVTCPLDNTALPGSRWDSTVDIGGTASDVIECNIRRNREYLMEFLGMVSTEE